MANAKVQSTELMNTRAFCSHQGYFNIPKPVLSQRKFANQTLGAFTAISAREARPDAPFHWSDAGTGYFGEGLVGGVLRSAEGQSYGKKALLARINQFNAIADEKQKMVMGMPTQARGTDENSAIPSVPETVGESVKIELNLLLQAISDALEGAGEEGDEGLKLTRFTNADAQRALTILFRFAPVASADDLIELAGTFSRIVRSLEAISGPDGPEVNEEATVDAMAEKDRQTVAIATTLLALFTKAYDYTQEMLRKVNLQPKDRLSLSKNLVSSLGFSRPLKGDNLPVGVRQDAADLRSSSRFTREAMPREDEEHGDDNYSEPSSFSSGPPSERGRLPFTPDERNVFGYRSGQYYPSGGRPEASFFGEEAPDMGVADIEGPGSSAVSVRPPQRRGPAMEEMVGAFDPDTQAFNVQSRTVSRAPSTTSSDRRRHNVAMADAEAEERGEDRLPTTAAELRQYNTVEELRQLISMMNARGIKYKPYAKSQSVSNIRKVVAKKLKEAGVLR